MNLTIIGIISYFLNLSLQLISQMGPTGVFILMILEGIGFPFPSEVIMTFSGFLSSGNIILLLVYTILGATGGFVGNLILYYISLLGGRPIILFLGKYIGIKESHLVKVEGWFDKKGEWTVFFGRFIPGFRSYMSIPAGIASMNIFKFSVLTFTGSLIWSTVLSVIGYETGKNWQSILPMITSIGYILLTVFIISLVAYVVYIYQKRNKR